MIKKEKTVLVTGVLGFIASHLAKKLLDNHFKVVGVDNFLSGNIKKIERFKNHPNFTFISADVNKLEEIAPVFYHHDPYYVFHYAACVGVQRTLSNPTWVLNDIRGLENIMDLSRKYNTCRVFFSSSSEVYGEPVEFPQNENTTPLNSKLPYAVVKNLGEIYLKSYKKEYGLDYTIFRFFNTFGPYQSEDFVMSKFIRAALENRPLTIYGDGSQTRTFCYIDDNIEATFNALDDKASVNRILNIGSAYEVPIVELAKAIINISGSSSKIEFLPPLPEGDMTRRFPDITEMKRLLGNRPLLGLEEGIKNTVQYFNNELAAERK